MHLSFSNLHCGRRASARGCKIHAGRQHFNRKIDLANAIGLSGLRRLLLEAHKNQNIGGERHMRLAAAGWLAGSQSPFVAAVFGGNWEIGRGTRRRSTTLRAVCNHSRTFETGDAVRVRPLCEPCGARTRCTYVRVRSLSFSNMGQCSAVAPSTPEEGIG